MIAQQLTIFLNLGEAQLAGLLGQDTVQAGNSWGVLNVLLCASAAQLGLDIVVQIYGNFSKMVD